MSLSAMSFWGRFCMRRKGMIGIVDRYTQRVKTKWLCRGWALKRPLLVAGGRFLSSYARTGWVNSPDLNLQQGPNFWKWFFFFSVDKWLPAEKCDFCKLINGWVCFESRMCIRVARALVWSLGLKAEFKPCLSRYGLVNSHLFWQRAEGSTKKTVSN